MSAYCTVAEIGTLGIDPDAYADATPETKQLQIETTSSEMDSYLASRYTLPLLDWPGVMRKCCAAMVACDLIDSQGRDPDADGTIDSTRKRWIDWLKGVAANSITPPDVTDSTPGAEPGSSGSIGGVRVQTSTSRGYSVRGTGIARGPFQTD